MNAKDRVYNRRGREVRRSGADWRMRSPSDEGRDNTTPSERGPLGSGGGVKAGDRTLGRIIPYGERRRRRREQTRASREVWRGRPLLPRDSRKAPDRTQRCLMLQAVPWENPMYGISGGAAGNVAQGGTVNPPRNRKGGAGNPPPTGARAIALPDRDFGSRHLPPVGRYSPGPHPKPLSRGERGFNPSEGRGALPPSSVKSRCRSRSGIPRRGLARPTGAIDRFFRTSWCSRKKIMLLLSVSYQFLTFHVGSSSLAHTVGRNVGGTRWPYEPSMNARHAA